MTDRDLDDALCALLAAPDPAPDPGFAERVVRLAAFDLAAREARRRAVARVGREALGLVAVLAAFVMLARFGGNPAGAGDTLPFASPAMLGLTMLALWSLAVLRPGDKGIFLPRGLGYRWDATDTKA